MSFRVGRKKRVASSGLCLPKHEAIANECHQHRSPHHEDEARIEAPGKIEEVLHLGRVRHARDQKAKTEDEPGHGIDEVAHGQPPIT